MDVKLVKERSAQHAGNWRSGGGSRGKADISAVYRVVRDGETLGYAHHTPGGWMIFASATSTTERRSWYFDTLADLRKHVST